MTLSLLAGSAHPALAQAIATRLGVTPGRSVSERFPDGELHVEISESMRGHDAYLIQPTGPPVESHLFELQLLADAARRAGAGRLTAIIPYFGYARQDRRARGREPVSVRIAADTIAISGVQRIVAVDLHSRSLEGVFSMPLEHLSAVQPLADCLAGRLEDAVVVAPDLGAAKLADRYARLLQLPVALVHKTRVSGSAVAVHGLTGDVRNRQPIIVDDMISTGGTVEAAIRTLLAAGAGPRITVVATHGLLVGDALMRLHKAKVNRLLVSDTLPAASLPEWVERVSVAPLLAEAVGRLHRGESLADLLSRG